MKLAIVDIEATSLKADQGFILCAGIKPLGEKGTVITFQDAGFGPHRYNIDKRLIAVLRNKMNEFDGWITWNGLMYDLPYIDDRLTICGEEQLEKRFARGLDVMWHAKQGKSTFQSARLDWVAKVFKCPYQKTALDINEWKEAEAEAITEALAHFTVGSSSYKYIVKHCLADLDVTEWVYEKLKHRIQSIGRR